MTSNLLDQLMTSNLLSQLMNSNLLDQLMTSDLLDQLMTSNLLDQLMTSNLLDQLMTSNLLGQLTTKKHAGFSDNIYRIWRFIKHAEHGLTTYSIGDNEISDLNILSLLKSAWATDQ